MSWIILTHIFSLKKKSGQAQLKLLDIYARFHLMKSSKVLFLVSVFLLSISFGQTKEKSAHAEKHGQKAHVHGSATLSIFLENQKNGSILFESPADNILGFEHEAKSVQDKKTVENALTILKNQAPEIFVFSKDKKCVISSTKIEIKKENPKDNHTEIEAQFSFTCEKDVSKSNLQINLGKKFPKIEDLDVQILSDKNQASLEVKKGIGAITF